MTPALPDSLVSFKDGIESYHPSDTRDAEARGQILQLLTAHGVRLLERDYFTPGHLTCSAMIVNPEGTHVLANHHGKCAVYMHFGGHWERPGETPFQTAMREACEEVFDYPADGPLPDIASFGFKAPLGDAVFDMSVGFVPERTGDPRHLHCDVRFVFTLALASAIPGSSESKHLKWMTWAEAKAEWTRDREIDSYRFLEKTQAWCQPGCAPGM